VTETPGDQPQWQQPHWEPPPSQPEARSAEPAQPDFHQTNLQPANKSSVSTAVALPSLFESGLRVLTGIAWPVAIALAVLGYGGWVVNLALAFVITAVFSSTANELKRRRKRQP
jgi:hypothetical protein